MLQNCRMIFIKYTMRVSTVVSRSEVRLNCYVTARAICSRLINGCLAENESKRKGEKNGKVALIRQF